MNDETKLYLIISLQQLLESKAVIHGDNNNERSKALSEKIAQILETIPELESFLDEKDIFLRNKLLVEIGRYIKFSKFEKGCTIKHSGEGDKLFFMVFYGRILKLNIVYKTLYASLKEYILYLAKLLIINEKYLYTDCIKKNQKIFKISETLDIIEYGKNIKAFDFDEEIGKIKKLKDEIFLTHIPEEEKAKIKINISELLSLYNPKIEERNHFLDVEQKFCVNLPFFYIDTVLDPISFIGDLNKSHGIKTYSTYICLNNCDIFYIDKTEINDRVIFSNINNNKSEIITNNLFKKHYIFKDGDINFLKKNYSKFFNIVKVNKDENVILQNSVYDGVYFIMKGIFELKIKRSYNELNELKFNIMNNNSNLGNNSLETFRDKKRDEIIQRLLRNPQFIKHSKETKEISFGTLAESEIIGLSDLYDKNNGIYNFSVKCISKEAELYFVSKEIFNSMLTNPEIEEKITKLLMEKIKILKLKIKRFTDLFEEEFDILSPTFREEKKHLDLNNLNISKKFFNISKSSSKIIPGQFQFKYKQSQYKQKKLLRSESDSKIFNTKTTNNNTNLINKNLEDIILYNFINYNKRYNNIFKNNKKKINFNISTNHSGISFKNNSKISNESKYDEIKSIKNLYSNRVNHIFLNNSKKNKNSFYSLSLINNKSNSKDKKIFLDNINYSNIKRKNNFINNKSPNIYNKQYFDHGRNRKVRKLFDYPSLKNTYKMTGETLIMPILNNKYNSDIFTFQEA